MITLPTSTEKIIRADALFSRLVQMKTPKNKNADVLG